MRRIPTLDGWRGIAILLVLIAHWQSGMWGRPFHYWGWLITGGHGVAIFFVLSGYLITSRLFHEESLKGFYIRRIFRLWPAAWVYIALLSLCGLLWKSEVLACLLLYRNFVFPIGHERALTGHFWSLSVEEQFYLVWPTALWFLKKRALWFAAASVSLAFLPGGWPYAGLCVGCVLAFAAKEDWFRSFIQKHHRWLFVVCVGSFCLGDVFYHDNVPLFELVAIAGMLACSSLVGYRWLEWSPLAQLGQYSYSMYVWQELLLVTHSGGLGILFLPIVTVASYHLIEKPCIRFGATLAHQEKSSAGRVPVAAS